MAYDEEQDQNSRNSIPRLTILINLQISVRSIFPIRADGSSILPRDESQYVTNVGEHQIIGVDYRISARGCFNFSAFAVQRRHTTTTNRMDPLQSWQRRHGIQPDAYRDLLSVLSSTPEAQQNISEYDIPTEHLAGLDIPGPFEVQAPILNVSGSVTINEELHLRAAAVASDSSNSWPVHTSIPATEFEVDGWNQLIQDSQPVLPNDDLLLFNSNDAWYNSQAASTQLAQSTHTESEQKQPSCTRCWKQKKAVLTFIPSVLTVVNQSQCKPTDGNICLSCAKAQLPPQVCVRVRFADQPVFAKCE